MTHRPPWRGERRLVRSVAFKPGALDPGDNAVEIGNGGKERRPDLARRVVMGTVVASRVEAQRIEAAHIRDSTIAEVDFGYRPADRLGGGEEAPSCLGRTPRNQWLLCLGRLRVGLRQAQEAARLVQHVAERIEAAGAGDQVQEVPMLAGGEVDP